MRKLDDVVKISTHPQDVLAYGAGDEAYGRMNRDIFNTVYRHYRHRAAPERFTLIAAPADYSGTSDTPYLQGLRSDGGLDDGIELIWTGPQIGSGRITAAEAAAYAGFAGRDKVLVWDNYPASDIPGAIGADPSQPDTYVLNTRLYLGPYEGRASDLANHASGIIANPARQAVASRIALGTMAAYVANPAGYNAETAWRETFTDMAGGDPVLADAIAALAENSRSGTLSRTESVEFTELRDRFLHSLDETPFWPAERRAFAAELARERHAPLALHGHALDDPGEAGPFLERLGANSEVSATAVEVLSAQRPSLTASRTALGSGRVRVEGTAAPPSPAGVIGAVARLTSQFAATIPDVHTVHGDRAGTDLNAVYLNENRVDAFVAEAEARMASWLPLAGLAAGSVRVAVQGSEVPVDASGNFAFELPDTTGDVEVVAIDGAGGRTGLRLSSG